MKPFGAILTILGILFIICGCIVGYNATHISLYDNVDATQVYTSGMLCGSGTAEFIIGFVVYNFGDQLKK